MKSVNIVGTGCGDDTLTAEAKRILSTDGNAVKVSGDVGFYSLAAQYANDETARFIPGVSSVQVLAARLKLPWQNARFVSMHGRDCDITGAVRRNEYTFCLTGRNVPAIREKLRGYEHIRVFAGENLGFENERVYELTVGELTEKPSKTILLFHNPDFDARVRTGIPDSEFKRGDAPMTKAEARAVTLSKLALRPTDICADIGAGTGSVTVEMALAAYEGMVCAIDKNTGALELLAANCAAFHTGNVTAILGDAPEKLRELSKLDAAFIGGGLSAEVFDVLFDNNPNIRVVANAVRLDTLNLAIRAFKEHNTEPEIVQIGVSKANKLNMLTANNPIFIISGGGL
ncbi:MAG: precorrin-6Y C5,15-methyltransferase (decarboxylating) subunit CbiT [Clostridiales bacterium]|nr:precorrin-6Y C5,15-methyltransferase (decarboxylating) subunit CbiT [Clostridiales bacterium]